MHLKRKRTTKNVRKLPKTTRDKNNKKNEETYKRNNQFLKCKYHCNFRQGRLDMKRSPPQ